MKKLLKLVGLVLITGLVGIAIWLWTPGSPNFDQTKAIEVANNYKPRIIRDAFGVPHIYGKKDTDVAFGLAYAHAEDDIANIQSGRRFSRGEMGLETGPEGAITDYLVAAIQARQAAEQQYTSDLSEKTRAILKAYTDGINFYCAEKQDRCEKGFAPISPQDLITAFVARTPFYYGFYQQLKKLFDGDLDLVETIEAARTSYIKSDSRIAAGSNAIAVAPSRSSDGHTRLMVNSHQPFLGPTAWYEARLKSEEGWDIIGSLFPGTPFVSHGTTPNLGWAVTVNKPDLIDFFKLTVNDAENPTQYLLDDEWRDFDSQQITIRVKLWGPFSFPSKQTIRRSVHGPVFDTPNGFFAASFAGDKNVKAVEQWLKMNKAKNYEEWKEAMAIQGVPSFNFVYADAKGNIAYHYNALVPIRSEQWDWSKVAPGDRSDLVWQGIHPLGHANPIVSNPSSGYVVSANHTPFESTAEEDNPKREDYPPHYGISDVSTNRGLRAQSLYGGDDEISGEEFLRYKMDNIYSSNSRLMTFIRSLLSNPEVSNNDEFTEALKLFSGWDGNTGIESRAAGLAIRTGQIAKGIQINDENPENTDPVAALRQAIEEYKQGFGRIDPKWGEVNRLKRGDVNIPLRGAPDVLRAIYSIENPKDGSLAAIAGDSYILYVDWDQDGAPNIQTIHQFGSATQDSSSKHYADQSQIFADQKFRTPPMELDDLLKEATADYTPGNR